MDAIPVPAHPASTIDTEACLERAVLRSDRKINATVAKIFYLLHRSADRGAFVRGERAWLQYRRRSCSAEASVYHGGSAEPVAFLRAKRRVTAVTSPTSETWSARSGRGEQRSSRAAGV
jgi:uncharacterized protein YecT (DUF1311 family)